jgi:hypothetical protein
MLHLFARHPSETSSDSSSHLSNVACSLFSRVFRRIQRVGYESVARCGQIELKISGHDWSRYPGNHGKMALNGPRFTPHGSTYTSDLQKLINDRQVTAVVVRRRVNPFVS